MSSTISLSPTELFKRPLIRTTPYELGLDPSCEQFTAEEVADALFNNNLELATHVDPFSVLETDICRLNGQPASGVLPNADGFVVRAISPALEPALKILQKDELFIWTDTILVWEIGSMPRIDILKAPAERLAS